MEFDFTQMALETQLNAVLEEIRSQGFAVRDAVSDEGVGHLKVIRTTQLALPGPSDLEAEAEAEKTAAAAKPKAVAKKEPKKSCRFCRRGIRGSNETGVCSAYQCQGQLRKEQEKASGK